MNLFELLDRPRAANACDFPAWALGCFRRKSITFFNGSTDATTLVIWLQSRGLTFDLRLAADRPRPKSPDAVLDAPTDDLARLAQVEGGIARTSAKEDPKTRTALLGWDDWDAFQPYPKWPEKGLLYRVGDCLVEFAPSGAYVEDWRYQSAETGPLIGLRLLAERDLESGTVLHRGGGLVVCGSRAGWVRGRARPLPANTRPTEMVRKNPRDRELLETLFDFEASYAERTPGGSFAIKASTLPWREGSAIDLDGFSEGDQDDVLIQRTHGRERRFRIDTLEPRFTGIESTAVSAEGAAWLDAERDTLCPT